MERGFTLLEILVAFVIMALALGVIMQVFSGALRNIGVAEQRDHAVELAQSTLVRLGADIPLAEGEQSGEDGDGYRWHMLISHFEDADNVFDPATIPVALYQVDLDVDWGNTDSDHPSLRFTTLRAGPRPQ